MIKLPCELAVIVWPFITRVGGMVVVTTLIEGAGEVEDKGTFKLAGFKVARIELPGEELTSREFAGGDTLVEPPL